LATRNASVPDYTGLTLPSENIGIVDNKGIEVSLTHRNNITKDLSYFIAGNFTYVKNKVINIDEVPNAEPYQNQTGKTIGAPLLYEIIGIFADQAAIDAYPHLEGTTPGNLIRKDVNGDGVINTLDMVRQDWTATPQIVFGLNTSVSYKGFNLLLGWQGQAKARIPGLQRFNFDPVSWGDFNPWLLKNGWTPTNIHGTKPRPGQTSDQEGGYTSTFEFFSSAFVRLKNAELSYNLPKNVISKIGVSECRVFVSGYNLFSFDALKPLNVDPETIDIATMPPDRIVNFGISLTF
jgi:hypothetical protein